MQLSEIATVKGRSQWHGELRLPTRTVCKNDHHSSNLKGELAAKVIFD